MIPILRKNKIQQNIDFFMHPKYIQNVVLSKCATHVAKLRAFCCARAIPLVCTFWTLLIFYIGTTRKSGTQDLKLSLKLLKNNSKQVKYTIKRDK